MKPKDRMFPTIDEHYQLRLQPVVSESYPKQRENRSAAQRRAALGTGFVDSVAERICKSATTLH